MSIIDTQSMPIPAKALEQLDKCAAFMIGRGSTITLDLSEVSGLVDRGELDFRSALLSRVVALSNGRLFATLTAQAFLAEPRTVARDTFLYYFVVYPPEVASDLVEGLIDERTAFYGFDLNPCRVVRLKAANPVVIARRLEELNRNRPGQD